MRLDKYVLIGTLSVKKGELQEFIEIRLKVNDQLKKLNVTINEYEGTIKALNWVIKQENEIPRPTEPATQSAEGYIKTQKMGSKHIDPLRTTAPAIRATQNEIDEYRKSKGEVENA